MLVVKHGRHPATASEHRHDFVKKQFARIFLLALFVQGIFSVFADGQHAIDRQLFSSEAECAGNGWIDSDVVFRGDLARHVAFGELIHVEAGDLNPGLRQLPVEQVRFEKILEEHVGMTAVSECGQNGGNLQPDLRRAKRHRRHGYVAGCRKSGSSRESPDLIEEPSAGQP